jgi:hypothetical protein
MCRFKFSIRHNTTKKETPDQIIGILDYINEDIAQKIADIFEEYDCMCNFEKIESSNITIN